MLSRDTTYTTFLNIWFKPSKNYVQHYYVKLLLKELVQTGATDNSTPEMYLL